MKRNGRIPCIMLALILMLGAYLSAAPVYADSKNLTSEMMFLDKSEFEYDGEYHAPELTVRDGSDTLILGDDYDVDFNDFDRAVDVGVYLITIYGYGAKGISGYVSRAEMNWRITDSTPPEISGVEDGGRYTEAVSFTVTDLRLDTVTLQKDSEEPEELTVTDGEASFTVSEYGEYTVTAIDLSENENTWSFTIAEEPEIEEDPADPEEETVPDTGAEDHAGFYTGLALFSAVFLAAVLYRKRSLIR